MTNLLNGLIWHVSQTIESDFVLKLSALEIYNETVVDLLNRESGSLRLLDDPEVYIRDSSDEEYSDNSLCLSILKFPFSECRKGQLWKN